METITPIMASSLNCGEYLRLKKAVEISIVDGQEKILDLGSMDGRLKTFLPEDCDYTDVDLYPKDKTILAHNLEKGLPPQLMNSKFDVIFMNEFIEHVENFKSLLLQCKEILSDKGRIIISTPSSNSFIIKEDPTHIHCFRRTNMENLAEICGLKLTKTVGTYVRLPVLNIYIPTHQTVYSDVILYRLE